MFYTEVLSTQDGDVTLSRIEYDNNFVWITFTKLKDKQYPDQELIYDYSPYIFNEFKAFLYRYQNKHETNEDHLIAKELCGVLEIEGMVEDIIELIKHAEKLKWNNKVLVD